MNGKIKKLTAVVAATAIVGVTLAACNDDPIVPYQETASIVVLDYNDQTSRPRTYYIEDGATMQAPAVPTREGYEIDGWYTEDKAGTKVEFPYTPTGSTTTLYAHWTAAQYDVVFNYNVEGSTPYTTKIEYSKTVEAPSSDTLPEYDGYYFFRWETKTGLPVSFPYTVRRDVEFFARWMSDDISIFKVTFNGNFESASDPSSFDVIEGEQITEGSVPAFTRSGYELKGWATTPDATEPDITFPYTPSASVSLYAVWGREQVRVRFQSNYTGSANNGVYNEVYVESGTAVQKPEVDPQRDGFTFKGWYTASVEGDETQFPLTVTGSTYVYAQWEFDAVTPEGNKFDAEFVHISPNFRTTTYSGNAQGTQIILEDDGTIGAWSAEYPLLDRNHRTHSSYYVAWLYTNGGELVFNIYSSAAVSGVTLYANLAYEIVTSMNLAPTGQHGFQIELNGRSINYNVTLSTPDLNGGMGNFQGSFREYQIASGLSLESGLNTLVMRVNNNTAVGAMQAIAPQVDYIRLDAPGTTLSWHPEYDNLYRRT